MSLSAYSGSEKYEWMRNLNIKAMHVPEFNIIIEAEKW